MPGLLPRRQHRFAVGLLFLTSLLLSLPGAAQQQPVISTSVANPIANTPFTLKVVGQWPNSCAPKFKSVATSANTITIEAGANESCAACFFVITDYSFVTTALTLPAGTYRVDYFVTDCGPVRTLKASRNVTVAAPVPLPTITFTAKPQTIQAGESSTLSWTTQNATMVTIDNGIGVRPTSGSETVVPARTTTYTLSATGAGGTAAAKTAVFVTPGNVPLIGVTRLPGGIVQTAGQGGATDQYSLTNIGRAPTTIRLSQTGSFFTQSPATFSLPAGATQIVSITGTAQPAARFDGFSIPSGDGVPDDLRIPIRLLSSAPPAGRVMPAASNTRSEIAAPADQEASGSVDFMNNGSGVLQGLAVADVPWLLPPPDIITIPPGQRTRVTFSTNRSLRPDAGAAVGAAFGTLSLVYLDTTTGSGSSASANGSSQATFSISIVDSVTPGAALADAAPLAAGEVALFGAALPQRLGAFGDLLLSNLGAPISDVQLFLHPPAGSSLRTSVPPLGPDSGVAFVSALKNIFATTATRGTIQARSAEISRVALASVQTNTANAIGSYVTALPLFRSDRFLSPGQSLHLPGVEKSTGRATNVFVQELGGIAGSVQIDFFDASGAMIATRPADSLAPFGLLALEDVVPAGAASVRVRNVSAAQARINAYAIVTDLATQDGIVIMDSSIGTAEGSPVLIPLFGGTTPSLNVAKTLFIVNPSTSPIEVSVDSRSTAGSRRRIVRSGNGPAALPAPDRVLMTRSVAPLETVQIELPAASSGYVRVSASGGFAASARRMLSAAGRLGVFGTALPAVAADFAIGDGQVRRFSGVDDASAATIGAARPVTYRSTLGLIETSGKPVSVRLTLRYTFSAGTLVTGQGVDTFDVNVPANQILFVGDLSRTVIGPKRDAYGDLRNMQLDVEVTGEGRVIPLLRTIDNGSTDEAVRTN